MKKVLILPLICLAAQATLVPALSLRGLIDQSEIIVHGRVTRSWAAWDSAHKFIWTHYRLDIIDHVKGNPGPSVTVSEPGGSLDGVNMRISGAPDYEVSEEAIVFLYRTPVGYLRATGYAQGKYTVTPETRVRTNRKGLELLQRDSAGSSLSALEGLSVADFKARVRDAMRSMR